MRELMSPTTTPTPLRWTAVCLYALAAFQVLVAVLLLLNFEETVDGFTGKAFAPTRDAAVGAAQGSLLLHVIMAALYVLLAVKVPAGRRWARIVATILLGYNVIGGLVALFAIADETPLNPIGIVLAAAALVLLWVPAASRAQFAGRRRQSPT
jgi:hypothetical protein